MAVNVRVERGAVSARFDGRNEMVKKLKNVKENYPKKLKAAAFEWAKTVLALSQSEYVPFKEGVLHDSGTVVEAPGDTIGATISYGGAASDYVVIQHETMTFNHLGGGGPKFLERPLMLMAGTAVQDIASEAQLSDEDTK